MLTAIKRILIGNPIPSSHAIHERLTKAKALAVYSSDALSSVAYATEAVMGQLILSAAVVGTRQALGWSMPIGIAIAALILIVSFSYRQTIKAYPQGGGAYIVTKDNMNTLASLVAGSALLVSYVLTVAVSTAAGVAALTSLATAIGVPWLNQYRVVMCVIIVTLLIIGNLRGIRESGSIFAVPTYIFLVCMFLLMGVGIVQVLTGNYVSASQNLGGYVQTGQEALGLFLILRAFAAGCSALTGIEAISDGVPNFKPPESKNAAITLTWMAGLLALMFLGITFLANQFQTVPLTEDESHYETVISQITRTAVGIGPFYWLVQVSTSLILILGANTAFADFPRLSWWLAKDRFMPRQFSFRGDRLAFSNGIIVLGVVAATLDVIFGGNVNNLLPLYAVTVFLGFTLSQASMVRRWLRLRPLHWPRYVLISGIGAIVTCMVMLIGVTTRFTQGAWIVVLVIPLLVLLMKGIHGHYKNLADQLRLRDDISKHRKREHFDHAVVVPISDLNQATLPALDYARSISNDVRAVHVTDDPAAAARLRAKWEHYGMEIPLVILESPYRSLIDPLLRYVDELDRRRHDDMLTIVLPEFVPKHWWEHILHGQTGFFLKARLMFHKNRVVTNVRYHLDH